MKLEFSLIDRRYVLTFYLAVAKPIIISVYATAFLEPLLGKGARFENEITNFDTLNYEVICMSLTAVQLMGVKILTLRRRTPMRPFSF